MKQEGLNSTRLAEMLGIQASGISHIMSGRNKPSYDFIVKLLHRFPQINPDWLLSDKGPMYRNEIKSKNPASPPMIASGLPILEDHPSSVDGNLFSTRSTSTRQEQNIQSLERDEEDIIPSEGLSSGTNKSQEFKEMPGKYSASAATASISAIERIIVFYKDKTFTEYRPE